MKLTLRYRNFFRDRACAACAYRVPNQGPMRQHSHEFWEIAIVLSGAAVHATEGFSHRLEPGDVLVIEPGRAHGYCAGTRVNIVNILFRKELLLPLQRHLGGLPGYEALFRRRRSNRTPYASYLHLPPAEHRQIVDWADRMDEESRRGVQGGNLAARAFLTLIATQLSRLKTQAPAPKLSPDGRFGQVLSWIEMHVPEPITVADMAAIARMSERSFHRAFRARLGMSPIRHLQETRLLRARDLLRRRVPRLSLTEIAVECGFCDSSYFSTVFSRRFGMPPSKLRAGG